MYISIEDSPTITYEETRVRGFFTDSVTTTVLELILVGVDNKFMTVIQDNISKKIYFTFRHNNDGFWDLKEMNAEDVTPRQLMNFFYGVNGIFTGYGYLKTKENFKIMSEFDEPLSELLNKGIFPRVVVKMETVY
jgi:hypothetical protein